MMELNIFLAKCYRFRTAKLLFISCILLFVENSNSSEHNDNLISNSRSKLNDAFCTSDSDDSFSQCSGGSPTSVIDRSITIIDSLDTNWCSIDKDESDYITEEELLDYIKTTSESPTEEPEVAFVAKTYLKYLDDNLDGVICKYELRYAIYHATNIYPKISVHEYGQSYTNWLRNLVGESPRKYSVHLVKLFQSFDEDINGKLTWKEVKIVIKMAEEFLGISESKRKDDDAKESLLADIKTNDNKWIDLDEFLNLLSLLDIKSDALFYEWLMEYLEGSSEYDSASESTRNDFLNYDSNLDGIISKGELIAALHNHRKDYYTDARINRRFTRSDRNIDGLISFNEYIFLENLKHPSRK